MAPPRLPKEAEEIFRIVEKIAPERFLLVGGTALAFQIGHRISEDLDFMFRGDRLPEGVLNALKSRISEYGAALQKLPPSFFNRENSCPFLYLW